MGKKHLFVGWVFLTLFLPRLVAGNMVGVSFSEAVKQAQLKTLDGQIITKIDSQNLDRNYFFGWASWCGFCHEVAPDIENIKNSFKKCKVAVNSINIDKQIGDAEAALSPSAKKFNRHSLIIHDPKFFLGKLAGVRKVPLLFEVNNKNEIISVGAGTDYIKEKLNDIKKQGDKICAQK